MKPTSFPETNQVLLPGNNPNTGQLPIAYAMDPQIKSPGICIIFSKWKPDEEELKRIIERKEVWIGVMTSTDHPTQPPIYCVGYHPFNELGFVPFDAADIMDRQGDGDAG